MAVAKAGRPPREPRLARRFYKQALEEAERDDFEAAVNLQGFDEEIAVLRLSLRALIGQQPRDFALMLRSIDLLVKAVATRYKLSPSSTEELSRALESVLRNVSAAGPEETK